LVYERRTAIAEESAVCEAQATVPPEGDCTTEGILGLFIYFILSEEERENGKKENKINLKKIIELIS